MTAALTDWAADVFSHRFENEQLLIQAVTHPSLSGQPSYQRLEFLGDRVLGLVVAEQLLSRFPSENEGTIARRFVKLVRRETLAGIARAIHIPSHIRLEPAARQAGVHMQDGVCADVMEALLGALYLDADLKAVNVFISAQWESLMASEVGSRRDPKTLLQEWAQGRGLPLPLYTVIGRDGPDHAPEFEVEVQVSGCPAISAKAGSKKLAEKAAAQGIWAYLKREGETNDR